VPRPERKEEGPSPAEELRSLVLHQTGERNVEPAELAVLGWLKGSRLRITPSKRREPLDLPPEEQPFEVRTVYPAQADDREKSQPEEASEELREEPLPPRHIGMTSRQAAPLPHPFGLRKRRR